jgi:hypothetical protein
MARELHQFREDAQLVEYRWPELEKKYPGQVAGAFKGKVRIARTTEELARLFRQKNLNHVAVRHLTRPPEPILILGSSE